LTLSVVSQTGPSRTNVYNCADIRLVESSTYVDPDFNCTNTIRSFSTRGDGSGFNPSTGEGIPAREEGLSDAAAGAIGAGVTLGLVGMIGALLLALGYLSFGKKSKNAAVSADDHSVSFAPQLLKFMN